MKELNKKLTLYGLTMIAIGSCIGSGIFVTPAEIVKAVPHHGYILLVWAIGGLIALTGALTFAELGGLFPKAGGVYVFLKEAYGDIVGFLYGWVILLVINTGALAALSMAFAEYMTYFFPLGGTGKILLAAGCIIALTMINVTGIDKSQAFANIFTGLKLLAIAGIVAVSIYYFDNHEESFSLSLTTNAPEHIQTALLTALIGVLWSFGGWHHASYIAGETINAKRNVPLAMILGTLVVTVTYLLINMAYMNLLTLEEIQGSNRVAGDAIGSVFASGGQMVAVAIAISIFGTIGIYTMTAPRIYFAMAQDGLFFEGLSKIHPKYKTPAAAMILQAIWAVILLLFWGSFHNLITYVTFMDIVFMTLAGISVFIFRKKRKDAERPYKVILYPIVPLIFILISAAFVVNTLIERPFQAIAGIALLGLGLPVYWWFREQRHQDHSQDILDQDI